MRKFKPYLKAVVRVGNKNDPLGLGIELFRLDAISDESLTKEESDAVNEAPDEASSTAVMRIYEEIGEDPWTGGGMSVKRFSEELDAFGDIKRLNVHINSLGGDVFAAQAIHSILCDYDAHKITAYIDGVAASAATIVACGADEVVARENSNYMIHRPWMLAIGNADTMRKAAIDLDALTVPIVNVYKGQCGAKCDEEKIKTLMDDETWLTAEQAHKYGFVDTVRGKIKAIARVAGGSQIMCSGRLMDVGKYNYRNVPAYPEIKLKKKIKQVEEPPSETPTRKEPKDMTKEDIEPKLLSQIEMDARKAERVRLAALDDMNPRNDPALAEIINKAKTEDKQPNEIAMECFKVAQSRLAAATVVNALVREAKPAGSVPAGEAPTPKALTVQDQVKKRITNQIAEAVKAQGPMPTNGNAPQR